MNGHMTVDNMSVWPSHIKRIQDLIYHFLVVTHLEENSLLLFVCCLVGDKITFEGSHL